MRQNSERVAWTVVLSAFFILCALIISIPLGLRWWLLNAKTDQEILLSGNGTVLVTRPGSNRAEANLATIPVGSTLDTKSDAQASLTFTALDGQEVLGSVQIYGNTKVVLTQADSPRYRAGLHPHRIKLNLLYGRARAFISLEASREVQIEIESAPGLVTRLAAPGSNASVEASTSESTVTVRDGEAEVSQGDQTVALERDERAEATATLPLTGPLPAERNLIVNGDFREPLSTGWVEETRQPADPNESWGSIAVVTSAGQRAVSFSRTGSNWGQVGITQEINRDIRDFKSLRLHLGVLVQRQDLFNCGQQGTECPVMVKIKYVDASNTEREWLQGFYYNYNPDLTFGPTLCVSCPEPRSEHQRVPENQWTSYDSPDNLLDIFQRSGLPPAVSIKSLTIYASGHTFNSLVAEVQLLGSE